VPESGERPGVRSVTIFALSAVVITAAFFCGGGSRSGFLGDVLVQLLSIPLLIAAVASWTASAKHAELLRRSGGALLLAAVAVFAVVFAVQLVPLPAHWFAGRFPAVLTEGGGTQPAWTQLSLTPAATWAAAVSAIPAFAVFAGVYQLDARLRFRIAALVIVLGTVALILGFLQVAQGPESDLRFYGSQTHPRRWGFSRTATIMPLSSTPC
jgi:hypothetical protein